MSGQRSSIYAAPDTEHPHKHWNQARVPTRAVRRRRLRVAGALVKRQRTNRVPMVNPHRDAKSAKSDRLRAELRPSEAQS